MQQDIDPSVWIAPGAQLYGRIALARGVSIWPHAVVRAEGHDVHVGRMSNIQDFAMIHADYNHGVRIGELCSITHHATIHGATIGDHCLIGIGATVMDEAEIGAGSVVAGHAIVREGSVFPPHSVIAGVPARRIAERDSARDNRLNAWLYCRNSVYYAAGKHRAWHGLDYQHWRDEMEARLQSDADLSHADEIYAQLKPR